MKSIYLEEDGDGGGGAGVAPLEGVDPPPGVLAGVVPGRGEFEGPAPPGPVEGPLGPSGWFAPSAMMQSWCKIWRPVFEASKKYFTMKYCACGLNSI